MDFHSLARRELQALCKKNKIPANMTNVAMADALNALEIVEGIEECWIPIESETAQSLVESPAKSETISPCVLRSVGRSTSRRNVAKEEPKTLPSRTTTRRLTRNAVAGDEGEKGVAIETPAVSATTRRAQVSRVQRKVEIQFEEEENGKDKKIVPPTPAPLGTISRRKVKEEEVTVKKVYSTRRSVRLAGKNVETLMANKDEKLETLKQELFTSDNLDMNLKQGPAYSDKVMEISGVGTKTMSEDDSEKMDNMVVVFEEEREESSVEERRDESEIIAGENIENQLDLSSEIQEINGSRNMCIFEADNALDNGVNSKDMEADCIVNDVLKNKDDEISCGTKSPTETEKEIENAEAMDSEVFPDMVVDENSCDVDFEKENQKELKDDDLVKDVESVLSSEEGSLREVLGDDLEADIEFIDHSTFPEQIDTEEPDSIEIPEHEQRKQDADELSIATEESLGEVSSEEAEANFNFIHHSTVPKQIGEKCDSVEILESEQSKQEEVQSCSIASEQTEKVSLSFAGSDPEPIVQSTDFTPTKTPIKKTPSKTPETIKKMIDVSDNKENLGSGSKILIFTEKVKTPSKTPTTNRKMTDVSDNKENLDSCKKLSILTKEKVKKAKGTTTEQNLHELSLRKLTKTFKEKLQITNQPSKNENDTKTTTATSRTALQALPENQLVDEAQI